ADEDTLDRPRRPRRSRARRRVLPAGVLAAWIRSRRAAPPTSRRRAQRAPDVLLRRRTHHARALRGSGAIRQQLIPGVRAGALRGGGHPRRAALIAGRMGGAIRALYRPGPGGVGPRGLRASATASRRRARHATAGAGRADRPLWPYAPSGATRRVPRRDTSIPRPRGASRGGLVARNWHH